MSKKLLLIDGNSMLFRAYYATCYTNIMKTSSGVYTNAVYAFAVMLEKALSLIHPDYCAVAFDKGKHTFRHEIASDYKGGRRETPEELVPQFAIVREFLKAYPIPYFECDDIEADDIIGTMSKKYEDVETYILSSDKDLLQLIRPNVTVCLMKKGITEMVKMDEEELFKEYQLRPSQIKDLKGLMGDASDNIKGVHGIGPKTAIKLLTTYSTCEEIYEHIDEIKGKVKEYLLEDKESCFLSKRLATIKTDVELDVALEELSYHLNETECNAFFEKYEMHSLIKKNQKPEVTIDVKKVHKISKDLLEDTPFVVFESNQFSYYQRDLFGLCFSNQKKSEYIALEDLLKDEETLAFLKGDQKKVVYDYKACMHCADYHGFKLAGDVDDLMLLCFLNYNYMDNLEGIFAYYGFDRLYTIQDIYGTVKKPIRIDENLQIQNAGHNAYHCHMMYHLALKELEEKELVDLYQKIEKPLVNVLYDMEKTGIYCDIEVLDAIGQDTYAKMNKAQESIYTLVGHELNLNSPKQLSEVLFDELKLPDRKKRSTSVEILQKLVNYHPVVSYLMEYRKYAKLYSTYAEGLKKYIHDDGKIHTIFSQTITQTGRLSSYDPNLQNISVKDEDGRMIRKAFKPSEGHVLISSDYSQIELRVLASLSEEEKMMEAFNKGIDIHSKTAMDVFGIPSEEVDSSVRRKAKAVNFGVVYGISDFGLSQQASLSIAEAKYFIEEYFKTYPNIKNYMDEQIAFCKENGYVKTMMGRRRYIKEIHDANYMVKEFGKRAAMNSPIQGSAADLIKLAMIHIFETMKREAVKSKMILQVHDELIFDVPEEELEKMKDIIRDGMINAAKMKVRLDSSLSVGSTWYEVK